MRDISGAPIIKLITFGAAAVLWPLLVFANPRMEWMGFWNSPFSMGTELLLAAVALCFGRTLGETSAFLLAGHWLFYHGVVTDDGGMPVLGKTFWLWFDHAQLRPIEFAGFVLAALIVCQVVIRLVGRLAEQPSLP